MARVLASAGFYMLPTASSFTPSMRWLEYAAHRQNTFASAGRFGVCRPGGGCLRRAQLHRAPRVTRHEAGACGHRLRHVRDLNDSTRLLRQLADSPSVQVHYNVFYRGFRTRNPPRSDEYPLRPSSGTTARAWSSASSQVPSGPSPDCRLADQLQRDGRTSG